jgi:transposase
MDPMSNRRKFTMNFKQQVSEEVLSGRFTAAQIARRHNLYTSTISAWVDKYRSGYYSGVVDSVESDPAHLRAKIGELERMVGKFAVENDVLKKAARLSLHATRGDLSVITGLESAPSPEPARSSALPGARSITKPKSLAKRGYKNKTSYAMTSKD